MDLKTKLKLGAGTVLAVLLVLFIFFNRMDVGVDFVFFKAIAPLWVVIVIAAVLGATVPLAILAFRASNRKKG